MAEIATIARPYAEALFQAVNRSKLQETSDQLAGLSMVVADPDVRRYADNPSAATKSVYDLIASALPTPVNFWLQNFLRTLIDNGRLAALPEIAAQFNVLLSQSSGVSDAKVFSAFPIDDAQLADVVGALEKRFNRKLNATVEVEPELIGGIRVVVGDEVLDTSVKARLEQMRAALTA